MVFFWKYEEDDIENFINSNKFPYIAMYNKYGKLEKIYDDYSEAAKDNDINVARIKECCDRIRNHSKEKRFLRFYNKNEIIKEIKPLHVTWGRKILQFDRNKNLIYSYKNMQELLSLNPTYKNSTIRNCCSGNRESAYNYIWKYA